MTIMTKELKKLSWWSAWLALAIAIAFLPTRVSAQDYDQQDDPPTRVARLGLIEGSVSFEPAGESDWVQAVPNRPITTGDRLWTDQNSRAELQLGSSVIRLRENTGFSFLNLDDHTVQIQLTSGAINIRVRRIDPSYDYFEIDTPNLAFTVSQPGRYRVEATDDGAYTVVAVRDGGGQATGNGQTYTLYAGQRGSFSGTDSLYADVEDIGGPDRFDEWAYGRDRRFEMSTSARYLSPEVVGFEDLDEFGEWRDDYNYGHVWFPSRVEMGWAPYHTGHWAWISPWGYTWVDDSQWGYAPFHYGRWVTVGGRWGWIPGPVDVRPVYAPALVVFVGGGMGFGGNIAWFPLGPREVYVPSYPVSRGYMNQVNVSNTTVNTTVITNVYNTTIINKTTTITNVTYANRNVQGAVMAVPQTAFASAQPVARAAVAVTPQQLASASVSRAAAVVPSRQSVLGGNAASAGHVAAPPAAIMNRAVVANRTPPPPPVPFAQKQQALAAHPGQPLSRQELQTLHPAAAAAARPMVKQAPPGKAATPTTGHPMNQPGNQPNAGRPGQPAPAPANQPMNRPNQPAPANTNNERPMNAAPQPSRPAPPPVQQQNNRPAPPPPQQNRPEANRPAPPPPPQNNRPPAAQPNNRPEPNQPPARPQTPPPAQTRPEPPPQHQQPAKQTPEQKKQEEEKKKKDKPEGV
ncbi:MAG: DUF6600 domain-containing protein [Terriglobales bacterium]